jgi:hypothetical protein
MPQLSDGWQNILLDKATIGDTGTDDPPATRYIGLRYNGTEVSATGTAYARLSLTSATFWDAVTSSWVGNVNARVNAADFTFATPTADWGYVNELCIYDGISDTEPAQLFYLEGDTGESLYILDGAALTIAAGQLILYYWDSGS